MLHLRRDNHTHTHTHIHTQTTVGTIIGLFFTVLSGSYPAKNTTPALF
jgi:hypothetical protein